MVWSKPLILKQGQKIMKKSDKMIGAIIRTTLAGIATVAVASYAVGVVHSSWQHYFTKHADEEDRIATGPISQVKVVESKKTKSRGGKK